MFPRFTTFYTPLRDSKNTNVFGINFLENSRYDTMK